MKTYQEVVKERYDGYEKSNPHTKSIYSLINPVGFYGDRKVRTVFHAAFNLIRQNGMDLARATILDVGCGSGSTTRFFNELTYNPQNIFGFDLSEYRIQTARNMNSSINYVKGDIIYPPSFPVRFDIVTALDVFMHLKEKNEILVALNNVEKLLNDTGYFLWFDTYSSDHFKTTPEQDHSGFHPKQMIELAEAAGFKKIFQVNVFKKIFRKYHSLYLAKRFPAFLVNAFENIFPGNPGNMLIVFVKQNK